MIVWTDGSDARGRFLDGIASQEMSLNEALGGLLETLLSVIPEREHPFDLLMLEVNCDTGRMIAGCTTEEGWRGGKVDGGSVRLQSLQDFYYDLVDAQTSEAELVGAVRRKVEDVGALFRERVEANLGRLRALSRDSGFTLRVFGSDNGAAVSEARYS